MQRKLFFAADGLVLIWVCKIAAWSIVSGRYVDDPAVI
jgi:hypothetical protein